MLTPHFHCRASYSSKLGAWLLLTLLAACTLTAGWAQAPQPEPGEPKPSPALEKLSPPEFDGPKLDLKRLPELIAALDRILEQVRGWGNPVDLAYVQRMRGALLGMRGEPERAAEAWRAAAAAWKEAGDGPGEIQALAAAGALLWEDQPEEGRRLLDRAVALARAETRRPRGATSALQEAAQMSMMREKVVAAIFGSEHPNPLDLAPGSLPPGYLAPVRALFQAAVDLRERREPESRKLMELLDDAGVTALMDGEIAEARGYHERELALAEKLDVGPSAMAEKLSHLASLAQIQGDFPATRRFLERALSLWKRLPYARLQESAMLEGLGNVALAEGDVAAARAYFQQVLAIRQAEKAGPGLMAAAWSAMGRLAQDLGDLPAAFQYSRQALELLESAPSPAGDSERLVTAVDRSTLLGHLGQLASQLGEPARGREYFNQALAIQREVNARPHAALTLGNLAALEIQLGDLAEAKKHLTESLDTYRRVARGTSAEALSLINLAIVASKQNETDEAATLLSQARTILEKCAPNSPGMALVFHWLSVVAHQRKDTRAAAELERRAVAVERSILEPSLPERKPENDLQRSLPTGSPAGALFAATLSAYEAELGHSEKAFLAMESGRAGALRRILGERQALRGRAGGDLWDRLEQVVAALHTAEDRLSRATTAEEVAKEGARNAGDPRSAALAAARAGEATQARSEYLRRMQERDALLNEIQKKAPRAFIPPLTADQAWRALPPGTLCAAFAVGDSQTILFLLKAPEQNGRSAVGGKSGLSVYLIKTPYEQLRKEINTFRSILTVSTTDPADVDRAGRTLFARLFPALAAKQVLAAKRLLISPDGTLWDVPFAALPIGAGAPARYLGEKPITYSPSLALYAQFRSHRPPPARGRLNCLVLGDPLFNRSGAGTPAPEGERFFLLHGGPPAPLPQSGREAREIAHLYGAEPLTGARATESAVRSRMGAADIIHLATHGYLLAARPMSSGVLLAAPDAGQPVGQRVDASMKEKAREDPTHPLTDGDGVLQAWEIFTGPRLRAELVVLSACETARGTADPGEGLVGLTRALQFAGARSVLASQWQVADASTATLMVTFQQKLRAGHPKDEALRQAIAALRKDSRTAHPYYWAPFVLIGDPDNPSLGVGRKPQMNTGVTRKK